MRGVVIGPGLKLVRESANVAMETWDPDEPFSAVRRCLPYWDRIDWPDTPATDIGTAIGRLDSPEFVLEHRGADKRFLRQAGVLVRTRVEDYERLFGQERTYTRAAARVQKYALQEHEKSEPGCWSPAQYGDDLVTVPDAPHSRVAEVELYGLLPAPSDSVSWHDILEFKSRHAAELQAMRALMDEAYAAVAGAADIPRERTAQIDRISRAVADLHRAYESRAIPTAPTVLTAFVNIALGTAATVGLATTFGIPVSASAAGGAALGALKFAISQRQNAAERVGEWSYLYQGMKEGVLR